MGGAGLLPLADQASSTSASLKQSKRRWVYTVDYDARMPFLTFYLGIGAAVADVISAVVACFVAWSIQAAIFAGIDNLFSNSRVCEQRTGPVTHDSNIIFLK